MHLPLVSEMITFLCLVIIYYEILSFLRNAILGCDDSCCKDSDAFWELVPDCRNIIFSYHFHTIHHWNLPSHQSVNRDITTDLKFALKHFKCEAYMDHIREDDLPLLSDIHSLRMSYNFLQNGFFSVPTLDFFSQFTNLVELNISDYDGLADEMFHCVNSLEVLKIWEVSLRLGSYPHLSDNMFTPLKHLRELSVSCDEFTDHAFEIMRNNGVRLEKLEVFSCPQVTDRAFSFMKGNTLREVAIERCTNITGEGLQHLTGVERLTFGTIYEVNCREAFKCLKGSAKYLKMDFCHCIGFDDEAMSCLKDLETLIITGTRINQLSDASFRYLSGSIKKLELKWLKGPIGFSKNMMWYFCGIQELRFHGLGIRIEAEDLSKWKQVLQNASRCDIKSDWADSITLEEIQLYVEGNGGEFMFSDEMPQE